MVGEAHSDLQAYSVAHRDIEGLGAVVMALQGHSQDSPRVVYQRKCVSPSLQEHNLLLVQGIVLQPIHLQELLGHADAGQLCKDAEVAGHPEASLVKHPVSIHKKDLGHEVWLLLLQLLYQLHQERHLSEGQEA